MGGSWGGIVLPGAANASGGKGGVTLSPAGQARAAARAAQQSNQTYVIDDSGGPLGEFLGSIKSFDDARGEGLIQCDTLQQIGYGDVYLHSTVKQSFQVGQ